MEEGIFEGRICEVFSFNLRPKIKYPALQTPIKFIY